MIRTIAYLRGYVEGYTRVLPRRIEYLPLCAFMVPKKRMRIILMKMLAREFQNEIKNLKVGMTLAWSPGYSEIENKKICWEAPLGLSVWDDDQPLFGVAIEFRYGFLCIRQLQGVAGQKVSYNLRSWPQRVVRLMVRFARLTGLKGIRLYRANTSDFYDYPHFADAYTDEEWRSKRDDLRVRLRRRYDQTAESLGFVMRKYWGECVFPCTRPR